MSTGRQPKLTGLEVTTTGTVPARWDPPVNWRATAVARHTDPETSHDAAASVRSADIYRLRGRIHVLLIEHGPQTDEGIYDRLRVTGIAATPSGARTRRSELCHLGLVVDSGLRTKTKTGRRTILWKAVR